MSFEPNLIVPLSLMSKTVVKQHWSFFSFHVTNQGQAVPTAGRKRKLAYLGITAFAPHLSGDEWLRFGKTTCYAYIFLSEGSEAVFSQVSGYIG
jgi:hypothetical protein